MNSVIAPVDSWNLGNVLLEYARWVKLVCMMILFKLKKNDY